MAGELSASIVYEDDTTLAFMDIQPVNAGHVLVIPKAHFVELSDMSEETGAQLFRIAMRVQRSIRASGVPCEGINLFLADGEAAFQEVLHVHLHVFPRYQGDSFKIDADWSKKPSREELDGVAEQIKASLQL